MMLKPFFWKTHERLTKPMKKFILPAILLMLAFSFSYGEPSDMAFTPQEKLWLEENKGAPLLLGLDPYSGMEYFDYQGRIYGYVPELAKLLEKELGVSVELVTDRSWGEVFEDLQAGRITLLFGANITPERLKTMAFTDPVRKEPYAVFSLENSTVQTMGDLDGKRIGFIDGDFVQEEFHKTYPQIHYTPVVFQDQHSGLKGLLDRRVDGFITSGGGIRHEFLFNYPAVSFIAEINTITSDMTFSTRKDNAILTGIIDKIIHKHQATTIAEMITQAHQTYTRKIMHMTPEEVAWLENKGTAVVGLADDYLPFDYYDGIGYKGISGAVLDRIHEITGIQFAVERGSFNDLYNRAITGEVDILNLALTEDRLKHFVYPRPISTERDIIIGKKSSNPVFDVYELEGKRVAVIEGFWHEEYLKKNLRDITIIKTKDIRESLKLVRADEADYLIENPTVAEYYINGLGYTDLVKKGTTSKDSFVYLGVTRKNPELASIMDKALVLIDYEEMKYKGIQSVPLIGNERNRQLGVIILFLALIIIGVVALAAKATMQLGYQRAETKMLKEREHLMYTDTLTGLFNRTYFNEMEKTLESRNGAQVIIAADLNLLKKVNDTYGHHMGDLLITSFAGLLKESLPEAMIFRMGGDEFLAFLADCDALTAEDHIVELKKKCAETNVSLSEENPLPLSAAFGYAIWEGVPERLDAAINRADDNMYRDKRYSRRKTDQQSNEFTD